jgi:MMP endo-(1,4)-3-O-methyl-alpha-D-mannosidase
MVMDIRDTLTHCTNWILQVQRKDGSIPWLDRGIFDPWNHTESAMALAVAGHLDAARQAYQYLCDIQRSDGALPGQCGASVPMDAQNRHLVAGKAKPLIDTNFTGYCALGVWHLYQISHDPADLERFSPLVNAAMEFVLTHQSQHGEIAWRAVETGEVLADVDALRTGNCSLYKSMEAAILIHQTLGRPTDALQQARACLGHALRHMPERFDRTWAPKSNFAMDWYYPVLCGLFDGHEAREHLLARRGEFIDDGLGCRCVTEQPWTTVAETCELAMALMAIDEKVRAKTLLSWCAPLRDDRGGFAMGWQSEEQIIWPDERPSWTAAAMVLALDAVHEMSPASQVLCGVLSPDDEAAPMSVQG